MKTTILTTIALSTFLFIGCNSGSSNRNNSASNNGMVHMDSGAQHSGSDHMTQGAANEAHAMLNVKGSWEMCKDRIEKAAKEVEGVSFASWEIDKEELHLNYDLDKTSEDEIAKAIAAAGHDTDKYKADQATYDALPGCCKYRD